MMIQIYSTGSQNITEAYGQVTQLHVTKNMRPERIKNTYNCTGHTNYDECTWHTSHLKYQSWVIFGTDIAFFPKMSDLLCRSAKGRFC